MQGCVRQRKENGKWDVVIYLGRDAEGKKKQRWSRGHRTKKEAQAELVRLLNELNTGTYVEPNRLNVAQYLDRWLKDYAKTNVSAKTFERYSEIIRLHLVPSLGHHLLTKLQPLHIQSYYTQALETGRKAGEGGLSKQTVLHHHRILREALHRAVKWQLIAKNPADAVEPPRPERKEMQALDEAETGRLLTAAKGTWLYISVLLAVATGMRRGEILALRWDDVDLKNGILSVKQSLEQTAAGIAFKQPKTAKSRRMVDLPSTVVDALIRHKAEQARRRLILGTGYKDFGLVVAQETGEPVVPSRVSKAFGTLVKRAGIRSVRFHDLRHTHASLLLKQGIHAKVVSERLGHSTVGITLDIYSHVMPGMGKEAALRFEEAIRAASPGPQDQPSSA